MINLYYFLGFCISIVNSLSIGKMPSFSTIGKTNYQPHLENNNWYVVGKVSDFSQNKPTKIIINDTPITVWRDKNDKYAAISDICPHRGVSLSKGRIDKHTGCVVCPYHTFKYNNKGRLAQSPGQKSLRTNTVYNLKTDLPYYKVSSYNDWVYLYNEPTFEISPLNPPSSNGIWHEPESYDPNFRYVLLDKEFDIDARTVTENSLDILHISEVHTFGNKKKPLPLSDKIERIADGHVKATYEYETSSESMAFKIFGVENLIVENEYILPHYTVARVKFGTYTNTIITSALPVTNNKTRLFVKAYRDNWVYNFPPLNYIFDKITENQMEQTLTEDIGVINNIYYQHRDGNFITKYDGLVKMYREDYQKYISKM